METKARILFFGSTQDSVIVLEKLLTLRSVTIAAVVTQPPKPVGRKKIITPSPVEAWAKQHTVTILTFPSDPEKPWLFSNEQTVIDTLQTIRADILISASYGVKIPSEVIKKAPCGGLNIHPSILPHWRGADPVPWAILTGDHQIGVTIVTLTERFDDGKILAQEKLPITPKDTSDPLRTQLFTIGADLLVHILPDYINHQLKGKSRHFPDVRSHITPGVKGKRYPYAKKFTRQDGYETWETISKAMVEDADAERIERKFRALHPWPGVWTIFDGKRLKLLAIHLENGKLMLDIVHLEGKKPVSWQQFREAYLST